MYASVKPEFWPVKYKPWWEAGNAVRNCHCLWEEYLTVVHDPWVNFQKNQGRRVLSPWQKNVSLLLFCFERCCRNFTTEVSGLPSKWCPINLLSSELRQAHVGHSGKVKGGSFIKLRQLGNWGTCFNFEHVSHIFLSPGGDNVRTSSAVFYALHIWAARPAQKTWHRGRLEAPTIPKQGSVDKAAVIL